jgi:hypothetical protein
MSGRGAPAGLPPAVRRRARRGWAIGGARFKEQIAAKLRRRVTPLPPGRPPKSDSRADQLDLL